MSAGPLSSLLADSASSHISTAGFSQNSSPMPCRGRLRPLAQLRLKQDQAMPGPTAGRHLLPFEMRR